MSKQLLSLLVALGVSVLATGIIAAITLAEWFNPTTPALLLVGAALMPAVLAGLLVISPDDQQSWTRDLLIKGATPGLIAGLLFMALGLTWTMTSVRTTAASKLSLSFKDATPLLIALNDASDDVAIAACKNLAQHHFGNVYAEALNSIANRPKVAVACLQNPSPSNTQTALRLSDTWHQTLLRHDSDMELACELSDALSSITSYNHTNLTQLLNCALRAQSPEARDCCATTIHTHHAPTSQIAEKLKHSHEIIASYGLAPQLLDASFTGSPNIQSTNLKTTQFQTLALKATCDGLHYDVSAALPAFYQLTQTLKCMPPDEVPTTSLLTWTRICDALAPQLITKTNEQPADIFCKILVQDNQQQAEVVDDTTPQDAAIMAQLADAIERGASHNPHQDMDNILRNLGLAENLQKLSLSDHEKLAESQKSLSEHLDKTNNPQADLDPDAIKQASEFQKEFENSDSNLTDVLNKLEKQPGLTKKQRESIKEFNQASANNPDFFKQ